MLEYDFEASIGYWLCLASRAIERALNEELAPHGITFPQWQVLAWLALEGEELSQSQLADRLRIEPPTLAGILDRMERDGWVRRHPSTKDRRKKMVRPTPRVRPIWDQVVTCARRVRARAVQGVDPAELETVKRVLATVRENLSADRSLREAV